jgi:hypothetical protein
MIRITWVRSRYPSQMQIFDPPRTANSTEVS